MTQDLLLGLGAVAIVEGLVLALLPLRLEEMLVALARMSHEQRRLCGLLAIAAGIGLVWLARG
jgi:hypothetical protein